MFLLILVFFKFYVISGKKKTFRQHIKWNGINYWNNKIKPKKE